MNAVLAHQGGWDEFLLVLVPILIIMWLLRLARRRVETPRDDGSDGHSGDVGAE